MEKVSTAERLKELMTSRNLRQTDILNAAQPYCIRHNVKLGKSDLSQYVSGKVIPGQDKLTILGLALNISEVWLMGYDVPIERNAPSTPPPDNILAMPKFVKKPRLGTIACGKPILAVEDAEEFDDVPEDIDCDFTLKCKGDSMINARIFDGDTVYIRQQDIVDNGEIAAVLIDDEATLKRVHLFDDHIVLAPENPTYKPYTYWNEEMNKVRILGKAIAFTSKVY